MTFRSAAVQAGAVAPPLPELLVLVGVDAAAEEEEEEEDEAANADEDGLALLAALLFWHAATPNSASPATAHPSRLITALGFFMPSLDAALDPKVDCFIRTVAYLTASLLAVASGVPGRPCAARKLGPVAELQVQAGVSLGTS
ncbi:MAG: hypothetical protein JWR24_1866 [Actinoallomurus sp.]|nr:hypothetical protein [Actinoallomurus sp.]